MSTKTLRKRIALVAVSAMGAGLLSLVTTPSAFAAYTAADTVYLGTTDSITGKYVGSASAETSLKSVGYVSSSATSVSGGSSETINALPGASLAFGFYPSTTYDSITAVVSGGVLADTPTNGNLSGDLTTFISAGPAKNVNTSASSIGVKPSSTVGNVTTVRFYGGAAGTISLTAPTSGTLLGTYAITTVAASTAQTVSAAKSTVVIRTSAGASTTEQVAGFTVANGSQGYIYATYNDPYGSAITSGSHYIQVAATGGAYVGFSAYPSSASAVSTSLSDKQIYVAQGTANKAITSTITVTMDGVVLATKTMTFLGELAKITASVGGIAKKGNTDDQIVTFKAYDGAGNRVPATVSVKGNDAVIVATVDTATTATVTGYLGINSATYGTNSGLYLSATSASGASISSNTFAVSAAGDGYTYTAALDKKEYNMGDIATLTVKFFDLNGKPANDITAIGTSTLKPSIGGGVLTAVNAPLYTDVTSNGVITYQYIVGNTAGTYSLAVDFPLLTSASGNATDSTKTIGYSVKGDGSVSNAAVLDAIVKLIASINKQIAALQKALMKK